MLALVKCLFWIIQTASETELVLAYPSFSPFTSESVTFPPPFVDTVFFLLAVNAKLM